MDLHQGHIESDWGRYFCHQPPVEFDTKSNLHLLCSELKSISVTQEENSDSCSSIWVHAEQPNVKACNHHSYALDARIRLNNLKAGCNPLQSTHAAEGMLINYNRQKDIWKKEEPLEPESALDLVELLDVEEDVKDEESWLYECPKKHEVEEKTESALTWCRQVLDNPSPEVEAACRHLINRLEDRSGRHSFRRPKVFHHTVDASMGHSLDKTKNTSDNLGNALSISRDFTTTSYQLHDITDVRTIARLQEASLRQDFESTPSLASPRTGPESSVMHSSYSNTTTENEDVFTPGNQTESSSSSCWQPSLSSQSSSSCQPQAAGAKQSCPSPKLARIQQQVTQFKLLKLAQNQASSSGRTRSPLRTSLRSLQAVRNSRSLETEDCQPADQSSHQTSGAPPSTKGSSFWPTSLPGAPTNSSISVLSKGDVTARIKKLQRSQSSSPCRIPHSAKGYLPFRGRVFASPERPVSLAWGRNVTTTRR